MKTKVTFFILAILFASIVTLPAARASERDQATKITFSQPVEVPGHVLPAGTYWFVLMDSTSNRNVVEIYNSDRSTLMAVTLTISDERLNPADESVITFNGQGSMHPPSIASWFYPGSLIGHEFLYAQPEERELAQAKDRTVEASANHNGQTAPSGD
jgi:hypothetical protein